MEIESILIADGKYEFRFNNKTGEFYCLRHGESWRDLSGDKAVYCLFAELLDCRKLAASRLAFQANLNSGDVG